MLLPPSSLCLWQTDNAIQCLSGCVRSEYPQEPQADNQDTSAANWMEKPNDVNLNIASQIPQQKQKHSHVAEGDQADKPPLHQAPSGEQQQQPLRDGE